MRRKRHLSSWHICWGATTPLMLHPQYAKRSLQNKKNACKNKKSQSPFGIFSFYRQNKKAGERLPIQRSPEIFRKPKKHPWFSSKNSVETSWSPLTPEHGFPSLFISARPKALPFCLPVFGLFLSDAVRNFH